uniref:Uncharacterized protein n=1 Tax=Anguilla anguilla TaxID=7936 RepID=A0A0E9XIG2_ANGAN
MHEFSSGATAVFFSFYYSNVPVRVVANLCSVYVWSLCVYVCVYECEFVSGCLCMRCMFLMLVVCIGLGTKIWFLTSDH